MTVFFIPPVSTWGHLVVRKLFLFCMCWDSPCEATCPNLLVHPAQHTQVQKLQAGHSFPLSCGCHRHGPQADACVRSPFPLSHHCADAYIAWFHLMPFGASCSGREAKWRNKTRKRRRGKWRTDIRLFLKEMFLVALSCISSMLTLNMCQFYVECNLRVFCTLFC